MTTMVETVARAIIRRIAAEGPHLGPPLVGAELDRYVDKTWHYWIDDAGAAIAAMRTPTEGMLKAAASRADMQPRGATEVWQAMVDDALAEKPV